MQSLLSNAIRIQHNVQNAAQFVERGKGQLRRQNVLLAKDSQLNRVTIAQCNIVLFYVILYTIYCSLYTIHYTLYTIYYNVTHVLHAKDSQLG